MDLRDWIAVAAIVVALLSSVITALVSVSVTRMNLRHNAQQEERRLAEDKRNRDIDRLRDTYASFASSGWRLTTLRHMMLKEGGGKQPPGIDELESRLKDDLDTALAMLQLIATPSVATAAYEYYETVITFLNNHIFGSPPPANIDEDKVSVDAAHGTFVYAVRQSLRLVEEPEAQGEEIPSD